MSDVFISYSRKDIAFARLLHESLQKSQLETWIDWARIPVGEKWWDEICTAIEGADVFLFIISQNSVGSNVCKDEIAQAQRHNKRIIPIIVDDTPEATIRAFAPDLTHINWILFKQDDVFRLEARGDETAKPEERWAALPKKPQFLAAIEKLNAAIHTDWAWVKAHTRLETRAREWERRQREGSLLLRGNDLREAENLLAHAGKGKDPQPTDLQRQYLLASRKSEDQRQRVTLGASVSALGIISVCLVIALVLGGVAFVFQQRAQEEADSRATQQTIAEVASTQAVEQRNEAELQAEIALSRQLAAQAINRRNDNFDLALLLGMEAYHFQKTNMEDTYDSRDALLQLLQHSPRLLASSSGHALGIWGVAFSPNGQTIASASGDNTIRLWDVRNPTNPKPIGLPLAGHTLGVTSVAFSPDGQTLASGSQDKTIRLWDVRDLANPQSLGESLEGHLATVLSVAFSPDGQTLASGSSDATIRLWDVRDPTNPKPLGEPFIAPPEEIGINAVSSVVFSPDGRTLASGSQDKTIRLWDVHDPANPKPLMSVVRLTGLTSLIHSVAFSPDGQILASGSSDATIRLWDVRDPANPSPLGAPLEGHTDAVYSVAFSPDGQTLASGSWDTTVRLWDVRDPTNPKPLGLPLKGHTGWVQSVTFSPDGKTLVSGSDDATIRIWDMRNPTNPKPIGEPLVTPPEEISTNVVSNVAFSPDGQTLASGSHLWDVRNPTNPQPLVNIARLTELTSLEWRVAFSPDGNTLAIGLSDKTIRLWDVRDPTNPKPLGLPLKGHTSWVASVAFSPDGKTLASGGTDATIRLWDVRDPANPRPLGAPLEGHGVWSVAFSPDGQTLASGSGGFSGDNTIRLWDMRDPASPRLLGAPLEGHTDLVSSVAFSPDGKTLASGSWDTTIRLWDVRDPANPKPLGAPLEGHTDWVTSVAFNPDGQTLVSGSRDKAIRLWDVRDLASPKPLGAPLEGHTGGVASVAFSPDGQILASESENNVVILWPLAPEQWIERACRMVGRNFTQVEWKQHMGDRPYHKTCEQWPEGK